MRSKQLFILIIIVIIDVLGFGIVIPLMPFMASRFNATATQITAIYGIYSLCQLLAAPLWGRLSDRYGRRPILISSLCGACLSYVMLALAHTLGTLLVARALAGAMAGNLAAAMAYASDISSSEERAKTLGMVGAAIGIGFMLGPPIGGVLAGDQLASANFVRPALLSAVLALVAVVLVLTRLPESRSAEERARHPRAPAHPWLLLRDLRALRALTIAAVLVTFSQSTLESIFAIWAKDRYGAGPRTVGLALLVLALVAVGTQGGLIRRLAPRWGEYRLAYAGIAGFVVGLTLVALGHATALVALGLGCCGLGSGLFAPSGSALASRQSTSANRGAVMGVYQSGTSVARVLAPFVAGPSYSRLGAAAPMLIAALVTLQAWWCIQAAERSARETV